MLLGLALLAGTTRADPVGAVLLVPAGVLALASGLRDLLLTPALRADATGLEVVDGLHRRRLPWAQVEGLRVVTDRRTPLLEVDAGEVLVVLSRRRLGASPYQVLEELQALRP
ncbi:MAG: PH domain-containing protein [Mycobacteriales bacterium]